MIQCTQLQWFNFFDLLSKYSHKLGAKKVYFYVLKVLSPYLYGQILLPLIKGDDAVIREKEEGNFIYFWDALDSRLVILVFPSIVTLLVLMEIVLIFFVNVSIPYFSTYYGQFEYRSANQKPITNIWPPKLKHKILPHFTPHPPPPITKKFLKEMRLGFLYFLPKGFNSL